jgi:hypothetical protein
VSEQTSALARKCEHYYVRRSRIHPDFRALEPTDDAYRKDHKNDESEADLTVRQQHEINKRVEAHTERVQAELELIRFPKYDRQGRRTQP